MSVPDIRVEQDGAVLGGGAGLEAAMQAAHPGSRPDLAGPAVADFARAWAHPDHWTMAEALERRRRAARGRT